MPQAKTRWQLALKEAQKPATAALKPLGFRKVGNFYNRPAENGLVQVAGFRSGLYTSTTHGTFTVNLGIHIPCVAAKEGNALTGRGAIDGDCEIREQLSVLARLPGDPWPLDDSAGERGVQLSEALQQYGVPFLDKYRSYDAIIERFHADGALPFQNPARSALAVAIIFCDRGDADTARRLFDEARRRAGEHLHFKAYVTEMQKKCGVA